MISNISIVLGGYNNNKNLIFTYTFPETFKVFIVLMNYIPINVSSHLRQVAESIYNAYHRERSTANRPSTYFNMSDYEIQIIEEYIDVSKI